jgi:hypothetical protein
MLDNLGQNMKNVKFCSQYMHTWDLGARGLSGCVEISLRETRQGNIQDWFQLDEGDPGFQVLTEEEIVVGYFLFVFMSTAYIIKYSIHYLVRFGLGEAFVCFIDVGYQLIKMPSIPKLIQISEGLLYQHLISCLYA